MKNDDSMITGKELTIKFIGNKGYLTEDKPLTFPQIFLPDVGRFFKSHAFWKVKVLSCQNEAQLIFCEVVSYHIGRTDFSVQQKSLADNLNEFEIVKFKSINTDALIRTLTGTTPISIKPRVDAFVRRRQSKTTWEPEVTQPLTQEINETFSIPFKEVHFKLGGVSFSKKFKSIKNRVKITISNPEIIEEFDAVKNYFAKVLKTKRIQVTAKMEITNNEVTSVDAKSPEIDKIDEQLIANVKHAFVKATQKKKLIDEIGKTLFTMDEYFTAFSDGKVKANTFYTNEKEFFEDLLTISKAKHYKHLRLLSSKHCHHIMKLRFVHKPFSFIFLIEGNKNYHLIWETLDTKEATYVWHLPKDINAVKKTVPMIEGIINEIKFQNKKSYIYSTDDPFTRIYHDYYDPVGGFVKWKSHFEKVLT